MLSRWTATSLVAWAPAKLNLFLRIVGRRADGYHDIETVMTTVDLYDTLVFSPSQHDDIDFHLKTAGPLVTGPSPAIPVGAENLVVRAAQLLKRHANLTRGVKIRLVKRIPSAAGLGGGSSDAAATLGALNSFWSAGLDAAELRSLATQLGSDVPFFLGPSSTAMCRGRGELLEPLHVRCGATFVIAKPHSGLSTPAVYKSCVPEPERLGSAPLTQALQAGRFDIVAQHLRNDLQLPAKQLNHDVCRLASLFEEQPVMGHQLSGSGTAYFGICNSRRQGALIAARLRSRGLPWVCVVQSRC